MQMKELFLWIDRNIEHDLNIDTIVLRSGYCRRQLHNIFKKFTGHSVATYIRLKRISYMATMLRLTNLSVHDLSIRFGFSTQQEFCRVFKRHYNMTPTHYRRNRLWDMSKYYLDGTFTSELVSDVVYLEEKLIIGTANKYMLDMTDRDAFWQDTATHVIKNLKNKSKSTKKPFYTAIHYSKSSKKVGFLEVTYTIENDKKNSATITIHNGYFLKVSYYGSIDGIAGVPNSAYKYFLSRSGFSRKTGYDLELIEPIDNDIVKYSYHIPIEVDIQKSQIQYKKV